MEDLSLSLIYTHTDRVSNNHCMQWASDLFKVYGTFNKRSTLLVKVVFKRNRYGIKFIFQRRKEKPIVKMQWLWVSPVTTTSRVSCAASLIRRRWKVEDEWSLPVDLPDILYFNRCFAFHSPWSSTETVLQFLPITQFHIINNFRIQELEG